MRGSLIVLLAALALLMPALVQMARPFFTAFILAALIATVTNPLCERLARSLNRPALAALATTVGIVLLLGLIVVLVGLGLSGQVSSAYSAVRQLSLDEGGWPALVRGAVDSVIDAIATRVPVDREAIRIEVIQRVKGAGAFLVGFVGSAVGGVVVVVVTVILVTIFLYFLLQHGKRWVAGLVAMTPLEPRVANRIITALQDSIVANVNGVFAVAMAQGLLLILGFWLVGLPSPVLWGSVGGLASVVPVVGAPIVWVPVAISYLVMGAYWKALVLAAWGSFIVGTVDNILRPLVVGARGKLHPVLIALGATGGAYAFGALGVLLGPLIVSFAVVLVKELQPYLPAAASRDGDLQAAFPFNRGPSD
jgi:predicted PurR-regulated permease PerM